MVERLARLSELVCQPGPDECVFLPRTVSDKLRPIRLDAPVQKPRAHHVVSQRRKKLGDPLPADVFVDAGLTNGLGFVEAFVRVSDNIEAGWQLQGPQWRMAVRVAKDHPLYGRGGALDDERARLAEQTGWIAFQGTHSMTARRVQRPGTKRQGSASSLPTSSTATSRWISPLGRTYRTQPPPITNDLPEPRPRPACPDYPSMAIPDDDRPILERPPPQPDPPPPAEPPNPDEPPPF